MRVRKTTFEEELKEKEDALVNSWLTKPFVNDPHHAEPLLTG